MTRTDPITISAVIPAYNCQQYIARSIDSVLSQTRAVDEVIVVDDGSVDGTAGIVKGYGGRVRYLHQANAGVSAARNTGIKAATCGWIAFLDADDEWLPDKIERQVQNLQHHPDLVWTTGNFIKSLCEENRSSPHTPVDQCVGYLRGKDYYDSYFFAVQHSQLGHTDCMLIQKQVFEDVGVFNTDYAIGEDIDLWLRIAYRYPKLGFVAEPLSVYRLSTPESLMKKSRNTIAYLELMKRQVAIARQEEMLGPFKPAAAFIMRRWIRGMLFDGSKEGIRALINQFPDFFSLSYRNLIYCLTIYPALTARLLRCLSKIVRALKLRKHLTLPPAALKNQNDANDENSHGR